MKKRVFIILSCFLVMVSCGSESKDSEEKASCNSVDDCISVYDFETARKLMKKGGISGLLGGNDDYKNIVIAESKYWANKGDIERALSVVDESWGVSDSNWPEEDWQCWRNNIIDIGVTANCEKGEFLKAKFLALKASEDLNVDGIKIGTIIDGWVDKKGNLYSSSFDCEERGRKPCLENKAKGPSMRQLLMAKIKDYQKLLK